LDVGKFYPVLRVNAWSTAKVYFGLMRRRELILGLMFSSLAVSASANGGGEKKKGGGTSFIQLAPITGVVLRDTGRRGVISVEIGIDVPSAPLKELAELSIPRLRAAYVATLQIYAAGLGTGRPPNADFLATEFQRQTNQVLGKPGAKLLLGSIIIN